MSSSNRNSEQRSLSAAAQGRIDSGAGRDALAAEASTDMAVCFADPSGSFSACNQAFTDLLGYSANELMGKSLSALFIRSEDGIAGDESRAHQTILSAVSKHGYYGGIFFVRSKSGGNFSVDLTVTVLRDSSAQPCAIVAFIQAAKERPSLETPGAISAIQNASVKAGGHGVAARKIDGTEFILASPLMHKFMSMVDRVAGHSETVLITGETGTGKELIARTIHESSHRRSRAWIDINCAALPENLVESELFGYEKGAFSGADLSKPGLFELADKGTLFLDEIGELQLHTQVKLLRVLDGQPFYRLGGHRKIKVDVRVVAATNQNLEAAVAEGRFRQDLYHRLSQFHLRVPPLRERPEDIVALAEHFLRLKAASKHFSTQAVSALLSHGWPGNIRELRNLVAKLAMESAENEIDFSRLSSALTGEPAALRQTASMPVGNLDSMEEQMIIKALERTGGHRSQAAEQLGISRRTLSRKLKEYNISFAPGDTSATLGFISNEQQKFFRARVQIPVTIANSRGEQVIVQAVNLSTGGLGLAEVKEPLRLSGLLDASFVLPETEIPFQAKARLMWVGEGGRVGLRFAVIEPALFEQLQRWTNRKMKEEGWDFPAE